MLKRPFYAIYRRNEISSRYEPWPHMSVFVFRQHRMVLLCRPLTSFVVHHDSNFHPTSNIIAHKSKVNHSVILSALSHLHGVNTHTPFFLLFWLFTCSQETSHVNIITFIIIITCLIQKHTHKTYAANGFPSYAIYNTIITYTKTA